MKITTDTAQRDFEKYLSVMEGKLNYTFNNMKDNLKTDLDNELIDECLNSLIYVYTVHGTMTMQDFIDDKQEKFLTTVVSKRSVKVVNKAYKIMKEDYIASGEDMVTGDNFDVFYSEMLKEVNRQKSTRNTLLTSADVYEGVKKLSEDKGLSMIGFIDCLKEEILKGEYDCLFENRSIETRRHISVRRDTSKEIREYFKDKEIKTLEAIEIIVRHKMS